MTSIAHTGKWGLGYTIPSGDWILMKIFASKEAADQDLPRWGNDLVPPETWSVRELDDALAQEAEDYGCPVLPNNIISQEEFPCYRIIEG